MTTVQQGRRYIVDTGSPTSFGPAPIHLESRRFEMLESHMGNTVEQLADYVGCAIDGLIGADILNQLDVVLDVPGGRTPQCSRQKALPLFRLATARIPSGPPCSGV